MIAITGAAGFIGSCLLNKLNNKGINDIVIVDDFTNDKKNQNLKGKAYREKIDREYFFDWLKVNYSDIDFVFHIGARTDTTEFDMEVFKKLNINYSKQVWEFCAKHRIPLVYASSAATYGLGELGYEDSDKIINSLKPLNPYSISKNEFDKFVISQKETPPFWAGLKFFNVYGPNEYHKGRMASVIFHAFEQIDKQGKINLFRSYVDEYEDGEQLRDFIYVKDVVGVCYFLLNSNIGSGIYNLGTGKARSFNDLAKVIFNTLNKKPDIEYIDIPEDIRDKYQYYTQATMSKLKSQGFDETFYTLEEGIADYVLGYLQENIYY